MSLRARSYPFFLAALSGLLLAVSFPSADFGPVAFIALVPLLIAIKSAPPRVAFHLGWVAGFIFFAALYHWMSVFAEAKAGPIGSAAGYVVALVVSLATAVFAAGSAKVMQTAGLPWWLKLVAVPSLWIACEYVRQLGSLGMGWGDLGYTQWHDPILLRLAPLTGVWGISWTVALINTALASGRARPLASALCLTALLVALSPLGAVDVKPGGAPYIAAALQANIDQDVPWGRNGRPLDPVYYNNTVSTFAAMTRQARAQGAQLCVMAETATPGYVRQDTELRVRMAHMAADNGVALLAGGEDVDRIKQKSINAAFLFQSDDPGGDHLQVYGKQHLVPFGEFVPLASLLGRFSLLRVNKFNIEAGSATQLPLNSGGGVGKIGVAICYESTYPQYLRDQVRGGAEVLSVITDDTWFGYSAAARQHEAMSAIRAAESSRYLVRCASTGISAIFAPDGSDVSEAGLFTKAIVAAPIVPRRGETVFDRYGEWFVWLCFGITLLTIGPIIKEERLDRPSRGTRRLRRKDDAA